MGRVWARPRVLEDQGGCRKRRLDERGAVRIQVGLMKVAQEPRSAAGTTPPSGHKTETKQQKSGLVSRILGGAEPDLKSGCKCGKCLQNVGRGCRNPALDGSRGSPRTDTDGHGRTGAGQAFTAFVSSLPIFQPQTTGALLPENARLQSVAESLVFPRSWSFPKDNEEKLPLSPQILPEGPAEAGRVRPAHFWSQACSLGHCCRVSPVRVDLESGSSFGI